MAGRRGITVLEIVLVLAVGAILAGVLGGGIGDLKGRVAVRSAESRLTALHQRARTLAVESGVPVRFVADPGAQTVSIREGCYGEGRLVHSHDFNLSHRVDMLTSGGVLAVCMTPGGYAYPGDAASGEQGRITFLRGEHSSSVLLSPMGRVARP
ncbi:MAG: hypothetical protein WD013_02390 [Gemmatimonadota bacterium]